jgi:hypothetical protein
LKKGDEENMRQDEDVEEEENKEYMDPTKLGMCGSLHFYH